MLCKFLIDKLISRYSNPTPPSYYSDPFLKKDRYFNMYLYILIPFSDARYASIYIRMYKY